MNALRDAFFRFGWLLPVVLPLAQIGGRALVNVLAALYLLWALVATFGIPARMARLTTVLYLALPLTLLISLIDAHDPASGFEAWVKFTMHLSVLYFTFIALQHHPDGVATLTRTWGAVAISGIVILYAVLPWLMFGETFEPALQLKEDNLPLLVPFGLYWLSSIRATIPRRLAMLMFGLAALGYIVLSQGRAALLSLGVALVLYGLLVLRMRAAIAASAALAVVAIGVVLGYGTFFRGMDEAGSTLSAIDRFTSERTVIWRHALQNPPESLLTGVGIGNLGRDNPVLQVDEGLVVGHLHNVLLDVWYETGLLGLAALLLLLVHLLGRSVTAWRAYNGRGREYAGVMIAAVAAILIGAQLSFSYGSLQFDVYMFMFLAALLHMSQSVKSGACDARAAPHGSGQ